MPADALHSATRNRIARIAVACLAGAAGLALPTAALASSGGSTLVGATTAATTTTAATPTTTTTTTATTTSTTGTVATGGSGLPTTSTTTTTTPSLLDNVLPGTVTGHNVSLQSATVAQAGAGLKLTGAAGTTANRTVAIEDRYSQSAPWQLATVASTLTGGAFSVRWTPRSRGQLQLRAVLLSGRASAVIATASKATTLRGSATAALSITVLQAAVATYYGALNMKTEMTACTSTTGVQLDDTTIGVASRTLKCGTEVTIYYHGQEIVVPVIDWGPAASTGAQFDLTYAVAAQLGILSLGRVTVGFSTATPASLRTHRQSTHR